MKFFRQSLKCCKYPVLLNLIIFGSIFLFLQITFWTIFSLFKVVANLISLLISTRTGNTLRKYFFSLYSKAEEFCTYIVCTFTTWWCEHIAGLNIYFYGESCLPSKILGASDASDAQSIQSFILISNHVSYSDWFSSFFIANSMGELSALLRWIVKKAVLRIPILGWLMYYRNFIGLERKFTDDYSSLVNGIKKYIDQNLKVILSIYPEGTFVDGTGNHDEVLKNCADFCKSLNLDPFKYVLTPRYKGLDTILSVNSSYASLALPMTQVPYFGAIVDATLVFSGNGFETAKPLTQKDRKLPHPLHLLLGDGPEALHVHLEKYDLNGPNGPNGWNKDSAVKNFLFATWQKKEKLLEYFDQNGKFPNITNVIKATKATKVANKTTNFYSWQLVVFGFILVGNLGVILYVLSALSTFCGFCASCVFLEKLHALYNILK